MNTVEKPGPAEKTRAKRSRWLLLLGLLLLVAAALLIAGRLEKQPLAYEPNVTVGHMPGTTQQEIQRALQAAQDEAMISYTVNSNPTFPDGASMGNWQLDCPEGNFNKLRFVITRDSDAALIYDSGPMEQGSYILEDYLQTDIPLAKGDYDCTVTVKVLNPDSEQEKGEVKVKIVLTVQS